MSFPHLSRSLRASGALSSSRNATNFIPTPRITHSTRLLQLRTISHTRSTQQNQPYQPTSPTAARPAPFTPSTSTPTPKHQTTDNISKTGLSDKPLELELTGEEKVDWTRSFHGLSAEPFPKEVADILLGETDPHEVEIKPDGIVYLPEIKYRRILNKSFGPGAWGLVPRSESIVTPKTVTREYALVCNGRYVFLFGFWWACVCVLMCGCRLVSVARGEQDYFTPDGIPTATEGCRSNALVRCCKDLGIASELWDPRWIRKFKAQYTREVFVEHMVTKRKSKIWIRKDDPVSYPWKESKF